MTTVQTTPFGKACKKIVLTKGITQYLISNQNYLFFDKERNKTVPTAYRTESGWYLPGSYNLIVLLFPYLFPIETVTRARHLYMDLFPEVFEHVMALAKVDVRIIPTKFASTIKHKEAWFKKNRQNWVEIRSWNDIYGNVPQGSVLVEAAIGGDTHEDTRYFMVTVEEYTKKTTEYGFVCIPGIHQERDLVDNK